MLICKLIADKRHESYVPRALDCQCELALVVRAGAGHTAGDDL